jgi:hypothetical protein
MSGDREITKPQNIWRLLAQYDHDQREDKVSGKQVHDYKCRRCAIELLLREANRLFDEPTQPNLNLEPAD